MKLFYKEDRNFLSPEDKHTLDEITLHGFFPFYLQKNTIGKDNKHFLSHIIVGRVEQREKNEDEPKICPACNQEPCTCESECESCGA